jgi:hypothetical protein
MNCKLCGKPITKSQLQHAQAIPSGYHTDCLDDQARASNDAYRRGPGGRLVNRRLRR